MRSRRCFSLARPSEAALSMRRGGEGQRRSAALGGRSVKFVAAGSDRALSRRTGRGAAVVPGSVRRPWRRAVPCRAAGSGRNARLSPSPAWSPLKRACVCEAPITRCGCAVAAATVRCRWPRANFSGVGIGECVSVGAWRLLTVLRCEGLEMNGRTGPRRRLPRAR